jgi:hypothetical protein
MSCLHGKQMRTVNTMTAGLTCDAKNREATKTFSPYALLLREPTCSIVTNVPDRADVRSISILGYN